MWESIELRDLRLFVVLAEELHFGRTAQRLLVTPGRVSQGLRSLEQRLGARLFDRTSRQVRLTAEGELLLARVRPALEELSRGLSAAYADLHGVAGPLRVGLLSAPSGGPRFVELVRAFEQRHPSSHLEVLDVALDDALGPLRRGEVDVMAMRLPLDQPDLEIGPVLAEEPRVLVVARSHPLAARASVTLEDVADERFVRLPGLPPELAEAILPSHTPSGRPVARNDAAPRTIIEVVGLVALGEVVHLSAASLVEYVAHPDVVYVPVVGMAMSRTALVWRRDAADARVRALVDTARELIDQREFTASAVPG